LKDGSSWWNTRRKTGRVLAQLVGVVVDVVAVATMFSTMSWLSFSTMLLLAPSSLHIDIIASIIIIPIFIVIVIVVFVMSIIVGFGIEICERNSRQMDIEIYRAAANGTTGAGASVNVNIAGSIAEVVKVWFFDNRGTRSAPSCTGSCSFPASSRPSDFDGT
jgi:hypothetical protein